MKSEWLPFFVPHFPTEEDAAAFVGECESINRGYRPPEKLDDSTPKVMMHQTVRLITLSESIRTIRAAEPLSLFFILVCAECVAKLLDHYGGERESRRYVKKFFDEHVLRDDKQKMEQSFQKMKRQVAPPVYLKVAEVADLLYDIRCDVVHEGRYWGFSFPDGSRPGERRLSPWHPKEKEKHPKEKEKHPKEKEPASVVGVTISLQEVRDIVVRGCIEAVKKALKNWRPGPPS